MCVALCALPGAAAWAGKAQAEYSVRWDPAEGGPSTVEQTLMALGTQADKHSQFEVQYFDIANPADAPAGFTAILRKRIVGSTAQLTYKLRGDKPWPEPSAVKPWSCPLPAPNERKEEVDVAFLGPQQLSKTWSRSCSHRSQQLDIAAPAALQPRPNSCLSKMKRATAGKLKVEEWRLPDGSRLIEVSQFGQDTVKASAHFRDHVVEPLLALQAKPVQRSKSSLGGNCH
jgi:hypothetical protein